MENRLLLTLATPTIHPVSFHIKYTIPCTVWTHFAVNDLYLFIRHWWVVCMRVVSSVYGLCSANSRLEPLPSTIRLLCIANHRIYGPTVASLNRIHPDCRTTKKKTHEKRRKFHGAFRFIFACEFWGLWANS